jgi:hypothetical protein
MKYLKIYEEFDEIDEIESNIKDLLLVLSDDGFEIRVKIHKGDSKQWIDIDIERSYHRLDNKFEYLDIKYYIELVWGYLKDMGWDILKFTGYDKNQMYSIKKDKNNPYQIYCKVKSRHAKNGFFYYEPKISTKRGSQYSIITTFNISFIKYFDPNHQEQLRKSSTTFGN